MENNVLYMPTAFLPKINIGNGKLTKRQGMQRAIFNQKRLINMIGHTYLGYPMSAVIKEWDKLQRMESAYFGVKQ